MGVSSWLPRHVEGLRRRLRRHERIWLDQVGVCVMSAFGSSLHSEDTEVSRRSIGKIKKTIGVTIEVRTALVNRGRN